MTLGSSSTKPTQNSGTVIQAQPVYIIEQFIPAARELLTTVNNAIRGPGLVTYD